MPKAPSWGLPTAQDFFLNVPLYDTFDITEENADDVSGIIFFKGTVDAYCIQCRQVSVFRRAYKGRGNAGAGIGTPSGGSPGRLPFPAPDINAGPPASAPPKTDEFLEERTSDVILSCSRNDDHRLYFTFRITNKTITKIGQYPSIADFHLPSAHKYRKILGDEKYREFSKGIALSSHDVGIGAFVYLRRIFEGLIEEAHNSAVKDEAWDETDYIGKRMDEKILLLKNHLPEFLVENRVVYSILSKGVHSLTEEECLEQFDTVKIAIELILDEKIEQDSRRSKLAAAKKAINDLTSKLTS